MAPLLAAVDFLTSLAEESLVIDLSELTFIDVAGVRALVEAKSETRRAGQHLRIIGAAGPVLSTFRVLLAADRVLESDA